MRVSLILLITFFSAIGLLFVLPYFWMLINSFKTKAELLKYASFFPQQLILDNFKRVFEETPIFRWFMNSVTISGTGTLIVLFTSSICGFVFAKYDFRWKNILFLYIIATMMVPSQTTMIPTFLLIEGIGLYDKLAALIIPGMISGFGIFLCRQFIENIPDSLCEAAAIDGAGPIYIYMHVIMPLIKPAMGALIIFTFLAKWNDYLGPLLYLSDPINMTMPLALSFFASQHSMDTGATMAAAVLVMLPVTTVFLVLQKQFVEGIAIAGMK